MIVDQLHGTLVAYEMRIEDEESPRKEATFKASSKQAKKVNSTKKDKSMTSSMIFHLSYPLESFQTPL